MSPLLLHGMTRLESGSTLALETKLLKSSESRPLSPKQFARGRKMQQLSASSSMRRSRVSAVEGTRFLTSACISSTRPTGTPTCGSAASSNPRAPSRAFSISGYPRATAQPVDDESPNGAPDMYASLYTHQLGILQIPGRYDSRNRGSTRLFWRATTLATCINTSRIMPPFLCAFCARSLRRPDRKSRVPLHGWIRKTWYELVHLHRCSYLLCFQLLGSCAESLLGEYSRQNSDPRKVRGIYLYAKGAARQVVSVLSHLGISESYTSLIHRTPPSLVGTSEPQDSQSRAADANTSADPHTTELRASESIASTGVDGSIRESIVTSTGSQRGPKPRRKGRRPGTLQELSDSCRISTRELAASNLTGHIYDNINLRFKVAETTLSSKGAWFR
jgi:hypothetical protein